MKNSVLYEYKKVKVSLNKETLYLHEMSTQDYAELSLFSLNETSQKEIEPSSLRYQNILLIHNCLKKNYEDLPKRKFIRRTRIKRLINVKYLFFNLMPHKTKEFLETIDKLSGVDRTKETKKNEFLGPDQGYAMLMSTYNMTTEEIGKLPVSNYAMLFNEAINQRALAVTGKFVFSEQSLEHKFKKAVAYNEIQELKRKGLWE